MNVPPIQPRDSLGINPPFWAQVLSYDGSQYYAWQEVYAVGGTFLSQPGGRSGTETVNPLYEANGNPLFVNGYYLVQSWYFDPDMGRVFTTWASCFGGPTRCVAVRDVCTDEILYLNVPESQLSIAPCGGCGSGSGSGPPSDVSCGGCDTIPELMPVSIRGLGPFGYADPFNMSINLSNPGGPLPIWSGVVNVGEPGWSNLVLVTFSCADLFGAMSLSIQVGNAATVGYVYDINCGKFPANIQCDPFCFECTANIVNYPATIGTATVLIGTCSLPPSVTFSSEDICEDAATFTIHGTGFTPTGNTVALNLGASGTAAYVSDTELTVTFAVNPTSVGIFTAQVTNGNGASSTVQVGYVLTTDPPTVTLSTNNFLQGTGPFTFTGTNFDPTPANNTVTLSSGTYTVTASTTTSITITFTVAPSLGSETAQVTTSCGGASGAAIQVATVVAAVTWTMENGSIDAHLPPETFTPPNPVTGVTSASTAYVGTYGGATAFRDLGTTDNTVTVTFTYTASENAASTGGAAGGVRWDSAGQKGVMVFIDFSGGPQITIYDMSSLGGWTSSASTLVGLSLTDGNTYTLTVLDTGAIVIASLVDDSGTQSCNITPVSGGSNTEVMFGWMAAHHGSSFAFTSTTITGITS